MIKKFILFKLKITGFIFVEFERFLAQKGIMLNNLPIKIKNPKNAKIIDSSGMLYRF